MYNKGKTLYLLQLTTKGGFDIMANTIEEMIKKSTCFGIAYDGTVRECKICEVKLKCESKCRLGLGETPQKPASVAVADKEEVSMTDEAMEKSKVKEKTVKAKKTVKEKANSVEYDESMPDFKPMSVGELEKLLAERGGNVSDFDKYVNPAIKKMRLTMALKKTYVKK